MTRKRDRFFAGFGAALFLITASSLTVVVLITILGKKDNTPPAKSPTASCELTQVTGEKLPAPQPYTPSGTVTKLEKTDLVPGSGQAAASGDCLQVNYYGTLASTGAVFDENFDKGQLLQFPVGKGQVIAGWDQGLLGLKVGGTRRLVIPPSLGYRDQANGAIPANSTLVFVVKLVGIKPN